MMCRRDFLSSERLVSAFLMTMKPVRLHKSVCGKANAVVSVSCAARFEERKAGGIRGLALHRAGRMDRRGAGAQRRSFHGCCSRPEKRSRPLFNNETTVAVRVSSCGLARLLCEAV